MSNKFIYISLTGLINEIDWFYIFYFIKKCVNAFEKIIIIIYSDKRIIIFKLVLNFINYKKKIIMDVGKCRL